MLVQQWDILCWKVARLEPLPNDRNIVGRKMSCGFGHPVAMCCDMSGVVGANLKMVQFFMQHLWILHDVVVVWQSSCTVAPGHAHLFDFQYTTCRSTSQQGVQTHATCCAQHVAPNNVAICYTEMLQSFGRSLQMLGQQCWDMLRLQFRDISTHCLHFSPLNFLLRAS